MKKNADGKILASGKVAMDPDASFGVLKKHCVCPELARLVFFRAVAINIEAAQADRMPAKARAVLPAYPSKSLAAIARMLRRPSIGAT